ncbi:MAG: hypothetical protein JXK93_10395 [Sphaerochaetaceae bacterium]|nr:hypothetical protein [Sphaerochaetaceae bacterium]
MEKKNRIIRHHNKQTGVTYLYWGHSTYIPGKTYPEVTKQCIGKLNSTGEFVPNKTFLTLSDQIQKETGLLWEQEAPGASIVKGTAYEIKRYGFTALIEKGSTSTGMKKILYKIYSDNYRSILSLLESLMTYPDRPLYRPRHFQDTCFHTSGQKLSEHLITAQLNLLDTDSIQRFLVEFRKHHEIDSRDSQSPYPDTIVLVISPEPLSGIPPLLMFLKERTLRPLFYRILNREESDCSQSSFDSQLKDLRNTQWRKGPVLIFSSKAYSHAHVNHLLRNNYRFFIELPSDNEIYLDSVRESSAHIHDTVNYYEPYGVYMWRKTITVEAPRRGRGANSYSLTLYLCLSPTDQITAQRELGRNFLKGKKELEQDPTLAHEDFYATYYHIHQDHERDTIFIEHNRDSQRIAMRTCGLRGYLASHSYPPEKAYQYIRARERLEPGFMDFLSRMKRPKHRLEELFDAKMFLAFLQSVIESWIHSVMDSYLLSDTHSCESIREELLEAFWKRPADQEVSQGSWTGLSQEIQKLFYIFSITDDSDVSSQVAASVRKELKQRKLERGLKID